MIYRDTRDNICRNGVVPFRWRVYRYRIGLLLDRSWEKVELDVTAGSNTRKKDYLITACISSSARGSLIIVCKDLMVIYSFETSLRQHNFARI